MTVDSKKSKIVTESGIVRLGNGSVSKIIVNSHTSGTIKLVDGLYNGVQASGVLTSSGASAPADYAIGTLTSTGVNVTDGDTVVMGATGGTVRTYRFKTVMAQADDVQIGADAETSLANLKKAIDASGTEGTHYFAGTTANVDVIGYTLTATTLVVAFRTIGVVGNAYTTTKTAVTLSWGGATLAGGVDTTLATITIGNKVYTATKTLSETLGLTAIANQVLWVTSEAVFLDNLKKAINLSGLVGTDYSTGTEQHTQVTATTNTDTAQTVVYKWIGTEGNSIATTETLGNYAWGATTLANGTGSTGRVINDTITFSAVATTGERTIDLGDAEFYTALLVIIGGTANVTVVFEDK